MAQLWTTGPAHFFVKLPAASLLAGSSTAGGSGVTIGAGSTGSQARYLGTCRTKPKIFLRKGNKPVYNDIGGDVIPFDKLALGEDAIIVADLNRYNMPVIEALADSPQRRDIPGFDGDGDVGTLWLTEGQGIGLYVWFPFARKAAYPMRNGYFFPGCTWETENPEELDIGTQDFARQITFHALRIYNFSTRSFTLYQNFDPAAVANLVD